jgi:predicted regulator of Ras-like GTPase activity (Roadblock/LC7/MglB family)
MQTTPILTIEGTERLLETLEDFLEKSEADYALVIDRAGFVLSQHGKLPGRADANVLAALAAGSFAATQELSQRVGEPGLNAIYQQGERAHVLMSAVNDQFILITVFGKQTTIGLVRFYATRTVQRIASVMHDMRSARIEPMPCPAAIADDTQPIFVSPEP